jgi:hypothetical protein
MIVFRPYPLKEEADELPPPPADPQFDYDPDDPKKD